MPALETAFHLIDQDLARGVAVVRRSAERFVSAEQLAEEARRVGQALDRIGRRGGLFIDVRAAPAIDASGQRL